VWKYDTLQRKIGPFLELSVSSQNEGVRVIMGDSQPSRFPEPFNQREVTILGLIKQGLTNQEIARKLCLSLDTIKWYNQEIFSKLGVHSRTQAIEKAGEYGLLDLQAATPARITPHPAHNLPAQLNSFIGRKKELASLRKLLQTNYIRLVTIVGPNGVGKTRLSLELSRRLLPNFRDGAYFVSLAPLKDPGLVAFAIAQAFGIRETSGHPFQETLTDSLRDRQLLLVLDNFEHVLPAGLLVSELLAAAPDLKILATSRAPLRVYGEQLFPLDPLSVPDPHNLASHENLLKFEGARLFVERATAIHPDFTLSAEDAAPVAKICCRLDGLPLAIELAAARTRTLSPAVMAAQFDGRQGRFPFPMLTQGARDAPARHQTLHNAIAWSHDLLQADQQALFRRLGVFTGGCAGEAAEAVCQGSRAILDALVDMNLLIQSEVEGEPRFNMLEMIRAYALEQLGLSGEEQTYRSRHAEYYLALIRDFSSKLNSLNGLAWIRALEREWDNLRNVLAWSLSTKDPAALEARVTTVYTYLRGMQLPYSEQRQWLEKAAVRLLEISPPAGDREQSLLYMDLWGLAGTEAYFQGDYPAARAFLERFLPTLAAIGDKFRLVDWLFPYCWTLLALGEYYQARVGAEQALSLSRELAVTSRIGQSLKLLAGLAWLEGDFEQAESLSTQTLDCFIEAQEPLWQAMQLANLGMLAQAQGDQARARELYLESLVLCWNLIDMWGLGLSLEKVARSAAAYGQLLQSARLFAAAQTLLQAIGYALEPLERPGHKQYLSLVRNGLDPDSFTAAWAEGQALTLEQAVAEALEAFS
jgi:predicted ATPase/DNA-binding CsgD family transcriptional regulator